jgi:hypothetical protein
MNSESKTRKDKKQKTATIQDLKDFLILESKFNHQRFEKIDERFESTDQKSDRNFYELKQNIIDLEKKVDRNNDEVLRRLDTIAGVIQDMRTENAATTYFLREHDNKIQDH